MCVYVFLYASVYMPVWLSARASVYNYVRVFCECVLAFVFVDLCEVLCVRVFVREITLCGLILIVSYYNFI